MFLVGHSSWKAVSGSSHVVALPSDPTLRMHQGPTNVSVCVILPCYTLFLPPPLSPFPPVTLIAAVRQVRRSAAETGVSFKDYGKRMPLKAVCESAVSSCNHIKPGTYVPSLQFVVCSCVITYVGVWVSGICCI